MNIEKATFPKTADTQSSGAMNHKAVVLLPEKMLGYRWNEHGVLEAKEVATPSAGPGEVLVKVHAAGVNPVDLKARFNKALYSTGVDGAGEIVAVGSGVSELEVGGRVAWHASLLSMRSANPEYGSFNQYAVVPTSALAKMPEGMSYQTAASLPCPGGTAHQIFNGIKGSLDKSVSDNAAVFVQSASGAVGRFVVQLLKLHYPNLTVIGSASPSKHDDLESLGVVPVSYSDGSKNSPADFEFEQVKKIVTEGQLYLAGIVDFQGRGSATRHYSALTKDATLVCVLQAPEPSAMTENGPSIWGIALGKAYDIEAGVADSSTTPDYKNSISPVATMRDSYLQVAKLVDEGLVNAPALQIVPPTELGKLRLETLSGKLIVEIGYSPIENPDTAVAPRETLKSQLKTARESFLSDALLLSRTLTKSFTQMTGFVPMNLSPEGIPQDSSNSALDAARATRGLCDTALAILPHDTEHARRLFQAAYENWKYARAVLRTSENTPIQSYKLDPESGKITIQVGESENRVRINSGALYPASDSTTLSQLAELLGDHETAKNLTATLVQEIQSVIDSFYEPKARTFVYHSDCVTGSRAESDRGEEYEFGVVGNDGTVYALSALLMPALQSFKNADEIIFKAGEAKISLTKLVQNQLDVICDTFIFEQGSLWENYSLGTDGGVTPIAFDWQRQPVSPAYRGPDDKVIEYSHVGIGGHTIMAAGQLLKGALELFRRGSIDTEARDRYVEKAIQIVNDAIRGEVVSWDEGVVRNGILVEVPIGAPQRHLPWGLAAWQQFELIQMLTEMFQMNCLHRVQGPRGESGDVLLQNALLSCVNNWRLPSDYTGGFADEWRYHLPQVARKLCEVTDH